MSKVLEAIRSKLNHMSLDWEPTEYLDTKLPDLHRVLGHSELGIPYGKLIEMSGWESQGKSAIALSLAALAQRDGATVVWGDMENSFDAGWARQRGILVCPRCKGQSEGCKSCLGLGIDTDKFLLIRPYVGRFSHKDNKGKIVQEREARLSTAQELCAEMEQCLPAAKAKKYFTVLDSVPALLTAGEADAGIEGGNLRTNMDLPMFLSRLLRRWVGAAQVHNSITMLINQLRTNPMAKFGSPDYTPGGNAPLFYCHVRVRAARVAGSAIKDKGKTVGIKGVLRNYKNKCGGEEGSRVGYRLLFNGPLEFVPESEVRSKEEEK